MPEFELQPLGRAESVCWLSLLDIIKQLKKVCTTGLHYMIVIHIKKSQGSGALERGLLIQLLRALSWTNFVLSSLHPQHSSLSSYSFPFKVAIFFFWDTTKSDISWVV